MSAEAGTLPGVDGSSKFQSDTEFFNEKGLYSCALRIRRAAFIVRFLPTAVFCFFCIGLFLRVFLLQMQSCIGGSSGSNIVGGCEKIADCRYVCFYLRLRSEGFATILVIDAWLPACCCSNRPLVASLDWSPVGLLIGQPFRQPAKQPLN